MDQQMLGDARYVERAKELYEWLEWFVLVMVCVIMAFTFVARTIGVFGESMEGTLHERDTLVVSRLTGKPRNGDIVALTQLDALGKPLIKRIIATENQTVDIDFATGDVTVDGVVLEEPYIAERIAEDSQGDMNFPQMVPEGCIFVMGDNRNYSWDSRFSALGMVDQRHILGTVIFRMLPINSMGNPDAATQERG